MQLHLSDTTRRNIITKVDLSAGDVVAGKVFYKQIVAFGTYQNPMSWFYDEPETMVLDEAWGNRIKENFDLKTLGAKVPVPLNHTDDVNANTGEVTGLEVQPDGLYAYMTIKLADTIDKIENGLIYDVSVSFDWDYVDTKEGAHHGPTLFHVALVNTPYLGGMTGFEEASDLSKAIDKYSQNLAKGEYKSGVIMMSRDNVKELQAMKFSKVKNPHDYETKVTYKDGDEDKTVTVAPGAEVEVPESVSGDVEKQLSEAKAPVADDDKTVDDLPADDPASPKGGEGDDPNATPVDSPAPVHNDQDDGKDKTGTDELSRMRAENLSLKAKDSYNTLLSAGKITPAQKEKFMQFASLDVSIKLSKDKTVSLSEALSAILNAGPKVIDFSENGSNNGKETVQLSAEETEAFKAMGVDPEAYRKRVESGQIKVNNEG